MGRIPLNDLSRTPEHVAEAREAALVRVARSGWYLRGPETDAFERELASAVGVAGAVGVGNGTDALELALRGLGCSPGSAVVLAANAGGYATTALLRAGLTPLYAEIDALTLGLTPSAVRRAVEVAEVPVKAVIVTHLYGRLVEMEPLLEVCRDLKLKVLEDCAQAIGAERGGRRAGAFGEVAAFSFYPTKNLGGLGDAGAVVSNDQALVERVRSLAQYGWTGKYRVGIAGGSNSRIDEAQAAVLRLGLPRLDRDNARRREILSRYAAALPPEVGHVVGGPDPGPENVAHLGVLWVADRAAVVASLDAAGIDTAVHYPVPDHRQRAWAELVDHVDLPVTESAAEHVVTLPLFPELADREVACVCGALERLGSGR